MAILKKIFLILALLTPYTFLITSCSYSQVEGSPDFERRHPDEFYATTGVLQYFLPPRPSWARSSHTLSCHQSLPIDFVNLDSFRASFGLSYSDALHFQHDFTILKRERLAQVEASRMDFRDRERLFYEVIDRVQSQIYLFQTPRFERIQFIWIDPVLENAQNLSQLKEWMKSSEMNLGHPIALSFCLNREQLESFLEHHQFDPSFRVMSYEFLSPYDRTGELVRHLKLDLDEFFTDKEIHLFLPINYQRPSEISGEINIKHY